MYLARPKKVVLLSSLDVKVMTHTHKQLESFHEGSRAR